MSIFTKITIRAMNPDGWPLDFEIDSSEVKTGDAIAYLEKYGFRPQVGTAPAAPLPAVPGGVQTTGSFAAETLSATVDDGKAYWKVKGGQFQKFGVTVYPEVLEAAGFDVDNLNPLKPVDLAGWTALYSVKESGKPQKVVRLERAG